MHILRLLKYVFIFLVVGALILFVYEASLQVPTTGDWKDTLKVLSTAEFKGKDLVTVNYIRDFQYDAKANPTVEKYYDKTYDLSKIVKVWYITEPFDPGSPFAHTFLSFQFSDNSFLAITIEARLKKGQSYGLINGTLHTFPLMYIAADERDAVYVRANTQHEQVYIYPLKANPADARLLLTDMLNKMNDLAIHPSWYNTVYANCTSSIANHVNKIWPGILPIFDWQVLFTSSADELALNRGLIDTTLPLAKAREKYYVTDIAQKVGYVHDYSLRIRGLVK